MWESAATIVSTVVTTVKSIRWTKPKREKMAYALGHLHSELRSLVKTGLSLIKAMKSHNNGREINMARFLEDLENQRVTVRRINMIFRVHGLRRALSIHAPQLEPLSVLVRDKGFRLEVLFNNISDEYSESLRMHPVGERHPFAHLTFPRNEELNKSRKKLKEMEIQLEDLRVVIVENFDIHEVM